MSDILTYVTSANPSLGVTTMVLILLVHRNFYYTTAQRHRKIVIYHFLQGVNTFRVLDSPDQITGQMQQVQLIQALLYWMKTTIRL